MTALGVLLKVGMMFCLVLNRVDLCDMCDLWRRQRAFDYPESP